MSKRKLADLLRKAHYSAPPGKKTLAMHLFGIWFADDLSRYNIRELRELADIPHLEPTIRDGMNLAEVVRVTKQGKSLLEKMDLA